MERIVDAIDGDDRFLVLVDAQTWLLRLANDLAPGVTSAVLRAAVAHGKRRAQDKA